jgi:prevent-host-death family protein
MREVDLTQASGRLAELIQDARNGPGVILTEKGHPVAKLVALSPSPPLRPREPGHAKGRIWMADDFDVPLEDFAEYM